MIELQHVSKTYAGGTAAVDDLSLTAPTGKITALVGPSGCGKTTTLRMVNRLIEPTSGAILLDGEDVTRGSKVDLRRRIGYVIQNAGLMPHRRVLDNVMTVPRLLGHPKASSRERAGSLLQLVGLDPSFADKFPAQLSGGQSQRVGVARALAADPPFLLMDEPFSAVDPVVRKQLQREFLSLQATVAKTIVIVTHDIDEALLLGDQIVLLGHAARIEQQGTPHDLLTRPASDFVSSFLGRGRGYHALSFEPATGLVLEGAALLREGAEGAGAVDATGPVAGDRWALVLDAEGRPRCWRRGRDERPVDVVDPSTAVLRACLDAALTGPDHRGVAVDRTGAYRGTFTAEAVVRLAAAPAASAASAAPSADQQAPAVAR